MDTGNIRNLVMVMGFVPLDGTSEVYAKKYTQHNNYVILVDFSNERIDYSAGNVDKSNCILVWDKTTSNFSKVENFVVLECVDRLLTRNYAPACLELEKRYLLGKREKGRLDVLVNLPDGTPYILIECKSWGDEFDKELLLMNRTGGQLFSYYANERAAKFLCLYASRPDGKKIIFRNAIVPIVPEWAALSGTKEIVAAWNGNFKNNGIFESDKRPYNITHTALTYGELQTITEEHSEKIFDLIMEILRHNVVSDKPNAFNKLLNLFICKIIDEDRQPDEDVDFQLLENDGKYGLQMRLNDLYKKGMMRFLNINVTDYSQSAIDELTAVENETKQNALKDAITKLRLQKNPEFAFIEVCDDKTFEANDKILREIVKLLQGFKFRYTQKHQFLGDFFELLLSTSIKQESGQFFTPVPITRFVLSAMPLKSRVDASIAAGHDDFLPTVIDYACGSGHFLVEYLEKMQHIIDTADFTEAKPSIKKMMRQYKDDGKFSWADKYVYGIDLDYRLVKTTKVSAYFNGDGEAKIIWASGLANFEKTPEYLGKLRNVSRIDKRENALFDILVSNPPYSVEAFKSTLDNGAETFELFGELTDKSKEIECLFVERMKQLLRPGGWAGIVLPNSIMTKGGIHAKTREILFKYFKFKAIVEMGPDTFMKTSTNTVILFLERRENIDWQLTSRAVDRFFADYCDVTVLGKENPFSKYANEIRGESFEKYIEFIKIASEDIIKIEKDKLLYFILTCSQKIVLVKANQKQTGKEFLGYEFSERRGREGLRPLSEGGKLFDESNQCNPTKVNSYIYNAFLGGESMSIHSAVANNISYEPLHLLINYNTSVWNKQVFLTRRSDNYGEIADFGEGEAEGIKLANNDKTSKIYRLGDIADYVTERMNVSELNSRNYVGVDNLLPNIRGKTTSNFIPSDGSVTAFGPNDILISNIRPYLKKIWFADSRGGCSNDVFALRINNEKALPKYVYYCLSEDQFFEYEMRNIGSNVKMPRADKGRILDYKVLLPTHTIQKKIIVEYEMLEKERESRETSVQHYLYEIEQLFSRTQNGATDTYALSDTNLFSLTIGKRVIKSQLTSTGQVPVYSANVFEPFGNIDGLLLKDFSIPSVLWGIDGDWMVSYMPENKPFYPTDHCGVLRVLSKNIHPRYLAWLLEREGVTQEFSRTRRASIDRIKSLNLSAPPITIQQKAVNKVFELEQKIEIAKQSLTELDNRRRKIMKQYL